MQTINNLEISKSIQNRLQEGKAGLNIPVDINPDNQFFIHSILTDMTVKNNQTFLFSKCK